MGSRPSREDYEGGLPSGEYRIGLACTRFARVTNLWETTIEVTQDPTDEPVGIAWRVTGPQPRDLVAADSDPSWFVYTLVAFGVAMAAVAVVLNSSARRPRRERAGYEAGEETEDETDDEGGAAAQEPSPV
jgi:hypothetical protein